MQERIQMQNERLHLRSPNNHVCFKVGIIGEFTENEFACAIQAVSQKHPMLKSTIEID